MEKSCVAIMSDVISVCSKKWSDPKLCNCDCDSNWFTNMYMDYMNNYISRQTFIEEEILYLLNFDDLCTRHRYVNTAETLMQLFYSVGMCQGALSYERIGEICIKILKGEV